MQVITLLASSVQEIDLESFARIFLNAVGIIRYQVRMSANYVDEIYVVADHAGINFVVAKSDEKNSLEFPFWIQITGNLSIERAINYTIDKLALERISASGLRVVRVLDFGKETQAYCDF